MAGLEKLKEDKSLGVIVVKHPSGMRETKDGHKSNTGEVGDTLWMGTDRKTYVVTKAEMKERSKNTQKNTASAGAGNGVGTGTDNGGAVV